MTQNNYEVMSDISSSIEGVDDIYNEIMYHVLGQFLVTKDNKNIATVLDELTGEIKSFRKTLSKDIQSLSSLLKTATLSHDQNNLINTNESTNAQFTSLSDSASSVNSPLNNEISSNNVVEEN